MLAVHMLACAHARECTCRRALRQDAWDKRREAAPVRAPPDIWQPLGDHASFTPGRTDSAIKNLLSASLKRESSSPSPP
eukprot:2290484-Pleurochrysis_carterae.AAC.1